MLPTLLILPWHIFVYIVVVTFLDGHIFIKNHITLI